MPFYFGDWIKEQRQILGLSQTELSIRSDNQITQSTISMWERKEILTPSILNIWAVSQSLGIPLSNVPWCYIDLGFKDDEARCSEMKERFGMYELPSASAVKTFEGKVYELKGFVGIEQETGEVKHITDLYYRTKTVVSESLILAKRKRESDELIKVKGIRKTK